MTFFQAMLVEFFHKRTSGKVLPFWLLTVLLRQFGDDYESPTTNYIPFFFFYR
jgi:hypothetical protein